MRVKNKPVVATFGEIMLRLSPVEKGERLSFATNFRVEPGGSESNVAIALANLGLDTKFISKLPENDLGTRIIRFLRQFDIDTTDVLMSGEKLGIYWTENGIGPRNSQVIYDRAEAALACCDPSEFNWTEILKGTDWFHFSGISPALSEAVFKTLSRAVKEYTGPVSIDLNYRKLLWKWLGQDKAKVSVCMEELCEHALLLSGNETDFQNILGINASATEPAAAYFEIASAVFEKFPKVRFVSISDRQSYSASHNDWGGFLYTHENGEVSSFASRRYNLESIKDRVGTGDSFSAGIIFGLATDRLNGLNEVVDFAATLSALNHSTMGDASLYSEKEVRRVLEAEGTGRILR